MGPNKDVLAITQLIEGMDGPPLRSTQTLYWLTHALYSIIYLSDIPILFDYPFNIIGYL